MIANVKEMLSRAQEGGYALGAFNTANAETTLAIIEAAQETSSPVIIQATEKSFDYLGDDMLFSLIRCAAETAPEIPVGIHLDHGKTLEIVDRALECGFSSVMYDGSRKAYADNVEMTRLVVERARAKGASVQAELGNVPYLGELRMEAVDWDHYMTDPNQAKIFVEESGIDTLAVAIGNAHGFFRERPEPDYDRLSAIREKVSVPLVLHGASDWGEERVGEVIKRGIACFNVDTAIRLAFLSGLHSALASHDETDIRKVLGQARASVKQEVKEKMRIFGSQGKAKEASIAAIH